MAEYYAVERSSEYLAHYGVRGMRWGVRKAMSKHSIAARDALMKKQYSKASKKLAKLNAKADINQQKQRAEKFDKSSKFYRKVGRVGLGLAVAGTGGSALASRVLTPGVMKRFHQRRDMINKTIDSDYNDLVKGHASWTADQIKESASKMHNQNQAWADAEHRSVDTFKNVSQAIGAAGAGTAIGAYGGAALHKIVANRARKRTTAEGHKKAVSERDAWQREMDKAFKGTKYANMPKTNSKKIKVINKNHRLGLPAVAVSNKPITASDRAALRKKYSRHK